MSWLLNVLSGWLPLGKNSSGSSKSFGEYSGKIIWVAGICIAIIFVVKFFEKKSVTTISSGGTQIINQAEPRDVMGFGCNFMRLYLKSGVKSK